MFAHHQTQAINPSYLSDPRNWPSFEGPTAQSRPSRPDDHDLVRRAGEQAQLLVPANLKRARAGGGGLAETLAALLASRTLNFNRGGVREVILPAITRAVAAGEPIRVVMPAFCKVGHGAKLMFNQGPSAAEAVSIRHLAHVSRQLTRLYSPGVGFVMVTDARLYAAWLRNPAPTATAYNQALRELAGQLATEAEVRLVEYDELLQHDARQFETFYGAGWRMVQTQDARLLSSLSPDELYESVRCSMNTQVLGMSLDDLRACFGPQPDRSHRLFGTIAGFARESAEEMLAVRYACRSLEKQVFTRAFGPNYIRATVHVSRQNPILGLRLFPDYKRASLQLPYHGVPLLEEEGTRVRMLVAPETRYYFDPNLERVEDLSGQTWFYRRHES
jgi:hypothetical protein